MDHQRRWLGQFGDAVDRRLQCRVGVGVRLLVEPDMAVADLHKREAAALGRYRLAAELQALRHAADHCPHEAGAGPSHELQHPPTVRIYIAFFGHSSLLVAIGVWVMSAISLARSQGHPITTAYLRRRRHAEVAGLRQVYELQKRSNVLSVSAKDLKNCRKLDLLVSGT